MMMRTDTPETLRALFDDLDPQSTRIESIDRQSLGAAVRRAAEGLEWTPTPSAFGSKLLELLDVPLPPLFVAFWEQAEEVAAALDASRLSPDESIEIALGDCSTEATLSPFIEVRVTGAAPPRRIPFEVRLPLTFKAAELHVQGGRVRRAIGGVCEIGGTLSIGDLAIARLTEPVVLTLSECVFDRDPEPAVAG